MIAFKFLRVLLSLSLVVCGTQAELDTPPTNLTTGFVHLANATREVSWFYSSNGLVVYDGDIIFGTTAEFNDALVNITHSSNNSSLSRRHDIPSQGLAKRAYSEWPFSSRLSPRGIVYYRYFDSSVESAASAAVNFAISTWTAAVPCLQFVQLPNDKSPGGANGIVTITNPGPGICATSLGYTPTAMWLLLSSGCGYSTLLHLFGHLLGLYHEHTRIDRDLHVIFNPACCSDPSCLGFLINPGLFASFDYDINSIMHYSSWTFSNGMCRTLTDRDGKDLLGAGISLSPLDISRVRELYLCPPPVSPPKCNKACSTAPGKCHPTAPTCISPAPGTANPRLACSCRAGFKATTAGIADGDVAKQWRLPAPEGNFRVWVAEGVECNTPCSGDFSCREVTELPAECLHT